MKKGELFFLPRILEKCTASLPGSRSKGNLQILFDFSDTEEFSDIIEVKKHDSCKKGGRGPYHRHNCP